MKYRLAVIALLLLVTHSLAAQTYTPVQDLTCINKLLPTQNPFHRLDPDKYKGMAQGERIKCRQSAGLAYCFTTDSPTIGLKAVFAYQNEGDISTANKMRGFDLYIERNGRWMWAGTVAGKRELDTELEYTLAKGLGKRSKNCILYLPCDSELTKLELITAPGSTIAAAPSPFKGRIAVFGSSFTHGAGASRCGMIWTAQLSRMTGYNFINLGYSGRSKLQQYFATALIEAQDIDAYVFDGFSNPSIKEIRERLFPFIERFVKEKPGTPLIFLKTIWRENRNFQPGYEKSEAERMRVADSLMRIAVRKYPDVYWVTSTCSTDEYHDCTTDGTHPDSHGYTLWAESIKKDVVRILKKTINKQD